MCFSKPVGDEFEHFVVLPRASHVPVVSLLKEYDDRLSSGIRLNQLGDFRRIAHVLARVSSESPSMRLGRAPRNQTEIA